MYFVVAIPVQFKILGKLLPMQLAYFIPSNGMTSHAQIWKAYGNPTSACFIWCIPFFFFSTYFDCLLSKALFNLNNVLSWKIFPLEYLLNSSKLLTSWTHCKSIKFFHFFLSTTCSTKYNNAKFTMSSSRFDFPFYFSLFFDFFVLILFLFLHNAMKTSSNQSLRILFSLLKYRSLILKDVMSNCEIFPNFNPIINANFNALKLKPLEFTSIHISFFF